MDINGLEHLDRFLVDSLPHQLKFPTPSIAAGRCLRRLCLGFLLCGPQEISPNPIILSRKHPNLASMANTWVDKFVAPF